MNHKYTLLTLLAAFTFFLISPTSTYATCDFYKLMTSSTNDVSISNIICTVSGLDGVDNSTDEVGVNTATIILGSGSSVTINANSHLVAGKFTFSGGTVAIQTTGSILTKIQLFVQDADSDGVADLLTIFDTPFAGRRLLSLMTDYSLIDCDSGDATKWQNQEAYVDQDGDGYGTGTGTSVCSGGTLPVGFADNFTDCKDTGTLANNVWSATTCYIDLDNDGFTSGSKTCTNNATCTSATKASTGTADDVTTYTAGRLKTTASGAPDCNDASYNLANICCSANGASCSADGDCCGSICGTNADSDAYFSASAGHTGTCQASAKPYTDCNDSVAAIYQNLTCYYDGDNDGYRTTAQTSTCTGADCTSSINSFKRAITAPIDCDDTNASKYVIHQSCVSCNCTCTQRLTTNGCGNCANTTYSCVGYCWTGATCAPSGSCIYCPVTTCQTCCTDVCGT